MESFKLKGASVPAAGRRVLCPNLTRNRASSCHGDGGAASFSCAEVGQLRVTLGAMWWSPSGGLLRLHPSAPALSMQLKDGGEVTASLDPHLHPVHRPSAFPAFLALLEHPSLSFGANVVRLSRLGIILHFLFSVLMSRETRSRHQVLLHHRVRLEKRRWEWSAITEMRAWPQKAQTRAPKI